MRFSRNLLLWLLAVIGLSVFPLRPAAAEITSAPAAAATPRNVLLLISDDHGLDLGCYGSRAVQTPRLDSLAARGVRFTNAYAAVSSCSPSRATLLTGMYNHSNGQYGLAHGAHNQRTRPNVRSLPRILSEKGYRTGLIGKHHVAPDDVYPFSVHFPGNNRRPETLRRETRRFLDSAGEAPFFLVVGFGDTHRAGAKFPSPGGDRSTSAPAGAPALPDFLPDLPEVRQDYAEYLESVNNLDRCVGAVLDALDGSGRTESTLIVFASDNGIPFPGAKTNLYDPGIRLPLIVTAPGPGTPAPATADAMVSWIDIAPTILDWAGISDGKGMQGRSLVPLLKNPGAAGWDRIFASHTFHEITGFYPMRCVRTRDFKLIRNLAWQLPYPLAGDLAGSPTWKAILAHPDQSVGHRTLQQYLHRPEYELYDLRNDPDELRNLAADEASSETLRELKAELQAMMKRTGDPWLQEVREPETDAAPRPRGRRAVRRQ